MRVIVFDTETTGLIPRSLGGMPNRDQLHRCPHIVQLSWVVYDASAHVIEDVQDHVIRLPDGVNVPEEAARIHGISTGIARAKGKPIAQVISWFRDAALSCELLVGHNISFDYQMIRVECLRNDINVQRVFARLVKVGASARRKRADSEASAGSSGSSGSSDCSEVDEEEVNVYIPRYCTMHSGKNLCKIKRFGTGGRVYYKKPRLSELYFTLFGKTPQNTHNSIVDCMITLRCYLMMSMDVKLDLGNEVRSALREAFQGTCYSDLSIIGVDG
jgi:DNA polymerase-3 subunit epsilon